MLRDQPVQAHDPIALVQFANRGEIEELCAVGLIAVWTWFAVGDGRHQPDEGVGAQW